MISIDATVLKNTHRKKYRGTKIRHGFTLEGNSMMFLKDITSYGALERC